MPPHPITLGTTIKRATVTDPYEPSWIPADLAQALADHAARRITDEEAGKVAARYVTANFLSGNLPDGDALFPDATEVWADTVEVVRLTSAPPGTLPAITAAANFALTAGPDLPTDQDAMTDWEDENTPLTDAINFFWKFGERRLLIGEHEGAGAGVEKFPGA